MSEMSPNRLQPSPIIRPHRNPWASASLACHTAGGRSGQLLEGRPLVGACVGALRGTPGVGDADKGMGPSGPHGIGMVGCQAGQPVYRAFEGALVHLEAGFDLVEPIVVHAPESSEKGGYDRHNDDQGAPRRGAAIG